MKGWLRKVGAGMAAMALGVPGTGPAFAQDAAQVSNAPQGGFTLKMNSDLVLTNVVVRDAKTGELVHGLKQSDFTHLRKRQATADRHVRF